MSFDWPEALPEMKPDNPNAEVIRLGDIRIVRDTPPNIGQIRAAGLNPGPDVIFTWGKTIYAPSGLDPKNKPLIAHERVHMKQQGGAVGHWWDRYLADPAFRLWQEVPAYHRQYQVAKRSIPKQLHKGYLAIIAAFLASETYGKLVSFEKASHLIQHGHV